MLVKPLICKHAPSRNSSVTHGMQWQMSDLSGPLCWGEGWDGPPRVRRSYSFLNLLSVSEEIVSEWGGNSPTMKQLTAEVTSCMQWLTAAVVAGLCGLPVHGFLDGLLPASEAVLALCLWRGNKCKSCRHSNIHQMQQITPKSHWVENTEITDSVKTDLKLKLCKNNKLHKYF